MEERPLTKKNSNKTAMYRTQGRVDVLPGLDRVRELARKDKTIQFTSLLHHVTKSMLWESYWELKPNSSPGIDGMTWKEYGMDLIGKIASLHEKVHTGTYRAQPSKRSYIPKLDGGQRALGIASLEDKIIQHAVAKVLNAIYEEDFLGFSYGFRPKRSCHDALDAVAVGMKIKKVNWVLDADIQGFFDNINHDWMMRFLKHRIADKRILRLINKWLKAGVTENGKWTKVEKGCPQGAVISPLLANIYLHYVLDLWVQSYRERKAKGDILVVRYADDYILGFQYENDAKLFLKLLEERFSKFDLTLHPDKTKLIRFGRFATQQRRQLGLRKPETFEFLGFTHICAFTHKSKKFVVKRQTSKKRMRKTLQAIKQTLMKRRHMPVVVNGKWLNRVVRGYFNYYAVPGNLKILSGFKREVERYWLKSLRRRSQRYRITWDKFKKLQTLYMPQLRKMHEYPHERFDAKYS